VPGGDLDKKATDKTDINWICLRDFLQLYESKRVPAEIRVFED
jgi:hypothetical protein